MGDDPVGALIGAILTGLGVLIIYGAYSNKKVFGAKGIVPTAISTGSLATLDTIPSAFDSTDTPSVVIGGSKSAGTGGSKAGAIAALAKISKVNRSLAERISTELAHVHPNSSRVSMIALGSLLTLASAMGFVDEVGEIRDYVKEVTDESI